MARQLDLKDLGAVGDGVANDTAVVNAALAANKATYAPEGKYLVTSLTNELGNVIYGPGQIIKATAVGKKLLNTHTDDNQNCFGLEYLLAINTKLNNNVQQVKVVLSGDSTTEGGGSHSPSPRTMAEQLKIAAADRGFWANCINAGHAGMSTDTWVSSYVANDAAQAPDLYIVRWGLNDVYYGRTIQQFAASLRAGLTIFRNARSISQSSILLLPPSAASDDAGGRNELWNVAANKVVRQVAREFGCAYLDIYAAAADADMGSGLWLDGTVGGRNGIHPLGQVNMVYCDLIADIVFKRNLNPRVAPWTQKIMLASDLPNKYPIGWSLYTANGFSASFGTAQVMTLRSADGYCIQHVFSGQDVGGIVNSNEGTRIGNANNNSWGEFITRDPVGIALAGSFVGLAGISPAPQAAIANRICHLTGFISLATVASVPDGALLGTLPVSFRPQSTVEQFVVPINDGTSLGIGNVSISSGGQITKIGTGNFKYMALGGISFLVGN